MSGSVISGEVFTTDGTYTAGTLQTFVVPTTGTYKITAYGAQGGSGSYGVNPSVASPGGLGGEATADFALTQGETLEIAVGQTGSSVSGASTVSSGAADRPYTVGGFAGGGGGGGSFVALVSNSVDTPLEVAGGGGGGSGSFSSTVGGAGGAGGAGEPGSGTGAEATNSGGGAGFYASGNWVLRGDGNSEGGFDFAGAYSDDIPPLTGGYGGYIGSILHGATSGGAGGFGGGGGGSVNDDGGGGGGYTGGGSGDGGTSYIAPGATSAVLTAGVESGDGQVIIQTIDPTDPAAPSLAETTTTTSPDEPVVQGTAAVGETITLYDNGTALGSAVADASGSWQFTFETALAVGTYTLIATASDVTGNVSAASTPLTIDVSADGSYTAIATSPDGETMARTYTSSGQLEEIDTASTGQTVSDIYDLANLDARVTQVGSVAGRPSLFANSNSSGGYTINLTGSSNVVITQGDDAILAGTGADTVFANGSATSVQGGSSTLAFFAGSGSSSVAGGTGATTIFGGASGGSLQGGSSGGNVLVAGGGTTVLMAGGSGDMLAGGSGANTLVLDGQDTAFAGAGASTVYGGTSDLLIGGNGSDVLATGGADTVWVGSGSSTVYSGSGSVVFSGDGESLIIDASTYNTSDLVVGGSGNSTIYGGAGNDLFFATGGGATTISDGAGTEEVVFGSGPTTVIGGSGTDLYDVTAGTAGGSYVISGFKVGTDQIRLFNYGNEAPQQSAAGGNLTLTLSDNTRITLLNLAQLGNTSVI